MPPPNGTRITIGRLTLPDVRLRILATWEAICSKAGYANASNCSSMTGRYPAMAIPTAKPTMPASASGVSKQRSAPKSRAIPSVTRNTPPRVPTSSPKTTTSVLAVIASRSARLMAPDMVTSWAAEATGAAVRVIGWPPRPRRRARLHHRSLLEKLRCGRRKHVGEQRHRVNNGVDAHPVADVGGERLGLLGHRRDEGVINEALAVQPVSYTHLTLPTNREM